MRVILDLSENALSILEYLRMKKGLSYEAQVQGALNVYKSVFDNPYVLVKETPKGIMIETQTFSYASDETDEEVSKTSIMDGDYDIVEPKGTDIHTLPLAPRYISLLIRSFNCVEDIVNFPQDPVATNGIRNVGVQTAPIIAAALEKAGYDLSGTVWEDYL